MMEAEEAGPQKFVIVDYFKNECQLKEETLVGKLSAARDDVNDRLTKMWALPEPESDTSSEFDSDSSASDEEKTNDSSVAEREMAVQTRKVMKGRLLQRLLERRNRYLMKSKEDDITTGEESDPIRNNIAGENGGQDSDGKSLSLPQNHSDESARDEKSKSSTASQTQEATGKDNTVATNVVGQTQSELKSQEEENGTKQDEESANTPVSAAGREEPKSLYFQQAEFMGKKYIDIVNPKWEKGKQTFFLNRFEHKGKECIVQTRVIKGGMDFLLSDQVVVRDIKPLSDSEKLINNFMIHNQCAHGELDTVAHLIDNRGVDPNVLDEVNPT